MKPGPSISRPFYFTSPECAVEIKYKEDVMESAGAVLFEVLAAAWDILLDSSLFVLFGFFVAGLLKGFIPDDFIQRHLGGSRKRGIFKASLFGIPIPLCSCGVIPAAGGLRQQGAGKGAVTSFMISTPETGVDSMAVTYALLDPVMTVVRPVAAFFTASCTGLLVNLFDREVPAQPKQLSESIAPLPMASCTDKGCGCEAHGAAEPKQLPRAWLKFRQGMSFAFGNLLSEIGPWLLFGIGLAAIITVALSPEFIAAYLGDGLLSMVIMIAVATPLYVCATASTPIAAALALKGLSPGAALVFLLAGPATNMATITVVARLLGRRTAVIYVGSIMACSLVLGLLVNWIYIRLGLNIAGWVAGAEHATHGLLYTASALLLLLLIAEPWLLGFYCRLTGTAEVHTHKHHHQDCHCGLD